MANTMSPAEIYTKTFAGLVDRIYKDELKSGILTRAGGLQMFFDEDVKIVKMRTLATSGNRNYNRATGYQRGDVNQDWATYTVTNERGIQLGLDILDGAEALRLQIAEVGSEYLRTWDVPEVDAVAFQKISAGGATTVQMDVVPGTTDVIAEIEKGLLAMRNAEVPTAVPKVIFMSPDMLSAYRLEKIEHLKVANADREISGIVDSYSGIPIIEVPRTRFADTVTLLDTAAGGFTIPAGARYLNMMIVAMDACFVFNAYKRVRFIPYDINKDSDENLILSRHFYDAFVISNKKAGVYVHKADTAIV